MGGAGIAAVRKLDTVRINKKKLIVFNTISIFDRLKLSFNVCFCIKNTRMQGMGGGHVGYQILKRRCFDASEKSVRYPTLLLCI